MKEKQIFTFEEAGEISPEVLKNCLKNNCKEVIEQSKKKYRLKEVAGQFIFEKLVITKEPKYFLGIYWGQNKEVEKWVACSSEGIEYFLGIRPPFQQKELTKQEALEQLKKLNSETKYYY